jgi:hypothetical protein
MASNGFCTVRPCWNPDDFCLVRQADLPVIEPKSWYVLPVLRVQLFLTRPICMRRLIIYTKAPNILHSRDLISRELHNLQKRYHVEPGVIVGPIVVVTGVVIFFYAVYVSHKRRLRRRAEIAALVAAGQQHNVVPTVNVFAEVAPAPSAPPAQHVMAPMQAGAQYPPPTQYSAPPPPAPSPYQAQPAVAYHPPPYPAQPGYATTA